MNQKTINFSASLFISNKITSHVNSGRKSRPAGLELVLWDLLGRFGRSPRRGLSIRGVEKSWGAENLSRWNYWPKDNHLWVETLSDYVWRWSVVRWRRSRADSGGVNNSSLHVYWLDYYRKWINCYRAKYKQTQSPWALFMTIAIKVVIVIPVFQNYKFLKSVVDSLKFISVFRVCNENLVLSFFLKTKTT